MSSRSPMGRHRKRRSAHLGARRLRQRPGLWTRVAVVCCFALVGCRSCPGTLLIEPGVQSQVGDQRAAEQDAAYAQRDQLVASESSVGDLSVDPPPGLSDPPEEHPSKGAGLASSGDQVRTCTGVGGQGVTVLCVAASARGDRQTGSASQPFSTIGAAVDASNGGEVIQIAAGTYRENVVIERKALTLLGGFRDDFAERIPATHVSTIEGVGGEAAVALIQAGASRVDGLRIRKGTGNELHKQYFILGGGIYADGVRRRSRAT
jgi:hypothetical protein